MAETILAVIRERGTKGLPLERVYRLLFTKDLYLRAYARLYQNQGAMTKGSTNETVDGMSLAKIDNLVENIRNERHRWTPVRRVRIPKSNGKTRPLGIPTWTDKLLQEVIRSTLEAYYEPQFSQHSHGFRPNRGCHTALHSIQQTWTGTRWFIEGDIAQYFDTIDHNILLEILGENIHDNRFVRLIKELLEAGYLEDWRYNETLSGTPQGGVVSPILANIYLHKFDRWVEEALVPAYTRGKKRKENPAYYRIHSRLYRMRKRGQSEGAKALIKQRRKLPTYNTNDEGYRRLRYVRYADDFLLGFNGTKREAEEIKQQIKDWLRDNLKLNLSEEKTLITHTTTQAAQFLGYEIAGQISSDKITKGRRSVNGVINLRVPADVVEAQCARYVEDGRPKIRNELKIDSDYSIVTRYQQEYRGIIQYYQLAINVHWLAKLHWAMRNSLARTLADKHNTTSAKILQKYLTTVQTPEGENLKAIVVRVERAGKPPLTAQFGGLARTRQETAILIEQPYVDKNQRTEIVQRLLADECELCGSRESVQVHHIRKLANLNTKGRKEKPQWVRRMAALRRKTLVVCHECHVAIHQGKPTRQRPE